MTQLFTNNASTTLTSGCLATDTTLVVASATQFPVFYGGGSYLYMTLANAANTAWEVVKITATGGGTSFTVVRGQDRTTAAAWPAGTIAECRPTAAAMTDVLFGSGMLGAVSPGAEITINSINLATLTLGRWHNLIATGGAISMYLPAASSAGAGTFVGLRIDPSSTFTIAIMDGYTGLIDEAATRVLWAGESAVLMSNGTNWTKVAGKTIPMCGALTVGSAQTFSSATATLLQLSTSGFNAAPAAFQVPGSYEFVCLRPGTYRVSWALMTNNTNTSATGITIYYYKNGASSFANIDYNQASYNKTNSASVETQLAAGDYLQLYGYYATGSFGTSYLFYADTKHATFCLTEIPTW